MIAPLRRNHFRAWMAISLFLAISFVVSLSLRRSKTPPNQGIRWDRVK